MEVFKKWSLCSVTLVCFSVARYQYVYSTWISPNLLYFFINRDCFRYCNRTAISAFSLINAIFVGFDGKFICDNFCGGLSHYHKRSVLCYLNVDLEVTFSEFARFNFSGWRMIIADFNFKWLFKFHSYPHHYEFHWIYSRNWILRSGGVIFSSVIICAVEN